MGELSASVDADWTDRVGALFDAHHQRLYQLARRLSQTGEDARDLVQETFLRVARSPGSLPHGVGEEAWLVRILVNIKRDEWRRSARIRKLNAEYPAPTESVRGDQDAMLIAHTTIWRALERLTPRRRAVLVLHELEGASIQTIAQLLGLASVTVRWHLVKARRELATVIKATGDQP